ncbi:L-arabinose ABC transporter permease AraH, partial [Vibrio parahaemolyticus]|nr:L-arabinose ABC transporter permease AraH [Vibrio parahaemolyticus]
MSVTSSTKILEQQDAKRSWNFAGIWDRFGMLMVFAGLFLLCAFFVP